MLNQIIAPWPMSLRVVYRSAHAVELVISGKDHRFLGNLPYALICEDALLLNLQVHEATENVQQTVALPHFTPEVGSSIASIASLRVSRMTLVTTVERQKVRFVPAQTRGHEDLILIHCEMHKRALGELEKRFPVI